jgi:hypothetical protein
MRELEDLNKDINHLQEYAETRKTVWQEENKRFCTDGYSTSKSS